MSFVRFTWDWLRRQVVDDVPAADALCEFDCRKPECSVGEWKTCERRLEGAAGELMPPQEPASDLEAPRSNNIGRRRN